MLRTTLRGGGTCNSGAVRNVSLTVGVIVGSILALAACGGDGGTATIEVRDPAVEIGAAVGDQIEIVLDVNTASGYRWEFASAPASAVVVPAGDRTEQAGSDESAVETQVITLDAVGAGRTTVEFRYVQPWVDPPAPRSTVSYDIRVNGSGDAEE